MEWRWRLVLGFGPRREVMSVHVLKSNVIGSHGSEATHIVVGFDSDQRHATHLRKQLEEFHASIIESPVILLWQPYQEGCHVD